jgi:hypothetical protein
MMGDFAEILFWGDLSSGFRWDAWKMPCKKVVHPTLLEVKGSVKAVENVGFEMLEAYISNDDGTVCRMRKNCPGIDFAGPGRRVYQVTVSGNHDLVFSDMAKLLTNLGYLNYDESSRRYAIDASAGLPLEFYWVVRDKNPWETRDPKQCTAPKGNKDELILANVEVVNACLEKHVVQYVLVLKYDVVDVGAAFVGSNSSTNV